MNLDKALKLMKIEKECIQRNKDAKCDRECDICDLVQHTDELLESYETIIDFVNNEMTDDQKYLDLIYKMKNSSLCKSNIDDYLIYRKDWLRDHLEQEFVLQKEVRNRMKKEEIIF